MVQKRWFIGILLPDDISKIISDAQNELVDETIMLPPLVPHITLMHPNPLMQLSPLYFAPLAKIATERLLPCDVELQDIGMFNKNVLFIRVRSPKLSEIHNKLVSALPHSIQAQYFVGREFVPHVTLAQARGKNQLDIGLTKKFSDQLDNLLPAQFVANELTRYEWQGSRVYSIKDL